MSSFVVNLQRIDTWATAFIQMGRKKNSRAVVSEGLTQLFPRLWRYCLVLSGSRDTADDLAQTVCIRALEKSELFLDDGRFDRWIFRMTQRIWLNELRSNAIRRGGGLVPVEELELSANSPDPETNILTSEVLREVMALPEAQRSTVLLVYVEGYSYREAGIILDIPIGTIMSRLAGARSKLAAKFEMKKSKLA